MSNGEIRRALEGITVFELVRKRSGAFTTMMLADMGTDFIKIEIPDWAPESGSNYSSSTPTDRSKAANVINHGRRRLVLNPESSDGCAILHSLAKKTAVFVEGFRQGVTNRRSAEYATLLGGLDLIAAGLWSENYTEPPSENQLHRE